MAKLGSTGNFPHGKQSAEDDGELSFGIGTKDGLVMIMFGDKGVKWMGMPPSHARNFAAALIEKADEVEAGAKEKN